ncbi:transforming growth factor beta receptor type 3-like [Thrips palmi]|uniref:Transforming growth factor beta receptor type 3-like n=1 Tax=Thrips palmi TaxID=161013 RepID=A0A6P8ZBS0_THRPL|nr:transforming growth factor beta receptor type 3-like [Thrips palmi]
MSVHFLLLFLKFSTVVAFTLPPSRETISDSSLRPENEKFEKTCSMNGENDVLSIQSWQGISQHAQGCSVPYYGPQGHGQYPEEVHIVHIMDVERLVRSLSSPPNAMVSVTLYLDGALCKNKTTLSEQQDRFMRNGSKFGEEQSKVKKENMPSALILKKEPPIHSPEFFAALSQRGSPQPSGGTGMNEARRPLVLLLISDQPVIWQIKPGTCWSEAMASSIQAMVEKDSPVHSDILVEVVPKTWVKKINRKNIQRYARRTFHGIASFTQIRAANLVRILVGPTGSSDAENSRLISLRNRNKLNFCDFSSHEESNLVSASLFMPLSAKSCVLGEMNSMKVFIMEVLSLPLTGDTVNAKTKNGSLAILPTVTVHLSENKTMSSSDITSAERNVTVILKSEQNVHWVVSSLVQQYFLNLVTKSEDTIECINGCDDVKLSSLPEPSSNSDFIDTVPTQNGSPPHQFNVNDSTGFTLTLKDPNQQIQDHAKFKQPSPDVPFPQRPIRPAYHTPPDLDDVERRGNIQTILESDMVITCGESVEVVVPAPGLVSLGVNTLHLRDQSCRSRQNGTHFILSSSLKGCGSNTHTDGRSSVISNDVYADFSSLNGNGVNSRMNPFHTLSNSNSQAVEGIPIACGVKSTLDEDVARSIFNSRHDVASEEDEDSANSAPNSGSSSLYQLELYHQGGLRLGSTPLKYGSLVDLNDRILVKAWMDDAPSAQAVAESCWVSNLQHSPIWLPNQKIVLLSSMCPVEKNVKLERLSLQTKSFSFSFLVTQNILRLGQQVYVHCQVGLCISSLKHSKGKPILCVDPQELCHSENLPSVKKNLSTAHQLLTRGPLRLSQGTETNHSFTAGLPLEKKCSDMSTFAYASLISMDMTVAIAVGSFIIGIGLTATLWFIHNKTEPMIRRGCHVREHSLGSQTAVMGSSLSPHSACSSTNSQSAIA